MQIFFDSLQKNSAKGFVRYIKSWSRTCHISPILHFLLTSPTSEAIQYQGFELACKIGNTDLIRYLLSYLKINVDYDNYIFIRTAVTYGHIEICKLLVAKSHLPTNVHIMDELKQQATMNGSFSIYVFLKQLANPSSSE